MDRPRYLTHMFDLRCTEHGIERRFTETNHPWTNGQVERMNRTIKDATVKRYHYDNHNQLRRHLDDFIVAYNFGRRLKRLRGLTPYEFICLSWATQPQRFIANPHHQMPGLDTQEAATGLDPRALSRVAVVARPATTSLAPRWTAVIMPERHHGAEC